MLICYLKFYILFKCLYVKCKNVYINFKLFFITGGILNIYIGYIGYILYGLESVLVLTRNIVPNLHKLTNGYCRTHKKIGDSYLVFYFSICCIYPNCPCD